jgi:putative oxidoreductase
MKFIALFGRVLFAAIFLTSVPGHFMPATIAYTASHGVPAASFLVPFSGVLELVGALSILLGYKAKWGAWVLVLFLVPVTFLMHNFWTISDPMQRQMDMAMFMKNISMTGAALFISYMGAGPLSLDARSEKAPRSVPA